MPYRIYAVNAKGNKITRMDLNPNVDLLEDRKSAQILADRWADAQTHQGPWQGRIEYYDAESRTANPLWNRTDGTVNDPIYSAKNVNVKPKPGKVPV